MYNGGISLSLYIYIHTYIYIYTHTYIRTYIYTMQLYYSTMIYVSYYIYIDIYIYITLSLYLSIHLSVDRSIYLSHHNLRFGTGQVAAVCVYPEFVPAAKKQIAALGCQMRVASVVNFPSGDGEVEQIKLETRAGDRKNSLKSKVILFRLVLQLKISLNSCLSCASTQNQFDFFF